MKATMSKSKPLARPLTFVKRIEGAGQLVHIVDIDGKTRSGKLKCFVSHIAEPDGALLHENIGFEEGTIASHADLRRRYKQRGYIER